MVDEGRGASRARSSDDRPICQEGGDVVSGDSMRTPATSSPFDSTGARTACTSCAAPSFESRAGQCLPEGGIVTVPFSGGCACGAVRYECSAEPVIALNCHCRDCQRASGTAYASGIFVPGVALRITKG